MSTITLKRKNKAPKRAPRIFTIFSADACDSLSKNRPPFGTELIRPPTPEQRKIIFSRPPKSMGIDRPSQSKMGQP